MKREIKLFKDGTVENNGSAFTRLVGGFGDGSAIVTTKQIAELLETDNRSVNQTINRNIKYFEEGLDIIDLKSAITESNSETLELVGYSKNAYNASKNIYILSRAGFLLYLKFAVGEKSVEVYKNFIEKYFKLEAKVESMENEIKKTIEELQEEKAMLYGRAIMSDSVSDKANYLEQIEQKNKKILELEKSMSEEAIVEKLSSKLHMSELIENSKSNYDIGQISKVLNVTGMGRNKMFEWLRLNKILMNDNTPYQSYMKYFVVIPVVKGQYTTYKTMMKPKGVDFVIKRLIKDGRVVTKPVEQILSELEGGE